MKYCYYCMNEIENNDKFCSFCGKDVEDYPVIRHHLKPGTILENRYVVGRAIGEGGFGITYMSLNERLDIKVAIKEYYPAGFVNRIDSSVVEPITSTDLENMYNVGKDKFLKEARVLAKFAKEPGVVSVIDFFEDNNTAYIVMEFLEGETLKDNLKRLGPKTDKETVELLLPVMKTLAAIHKKGLIHRDISPDNIMLTEDGLKLLDFGAARNFADAENKSMSVFLKEGYAPAEQYRKRGEQGPWTDVYAMCGTMYRCVTGKVPLDAMERMYDDELKSPKELGINIDENINNAIMHGLAVKSNERIQSIEQLIDELQSLNDDPKTKLLFVREDVLPKDSSGEAVEEPKEEKADEESAEVVEEPKEEKADEEPVVKEKLATEEELAVEESVEKIEEELAAEESVEAIEEELAAEESVEAIEEELEVGEAVEDIEELPDSEEYMESDIKSRGWRNRNKRWKDRRDRPLFTVNS